MTVTYTSEVTTCRGFSKFLKLLARCFRWRGSIYKIVWVDLLMFLGLYYAILILYRVILDQDSKRSFEKIVKYCDKNLSLVPLSFILGFYVNLITTRWWGQYTSIPFPDNIAILIGASIKGTDERARIVRRTIVRYVCATFTITLTMLSPRVKKRFPTLDHFIEAGLLTKDEKKIMNALDNEFPSYSKYWLPLAWAANIITRGRHDGLILDDVSVKTILEEFNKFRNHCGAMLDYDWISVPLVYTQVVTLVVYLYFVLSAVGKQYVDVAGDDIDLYFPFFPVLEFFFYMGWLKVAEVLINPYGDDDDDFEVVWMVDRHLQVCYLLVDKIHQEHPKLIKDMHWAETAPNALPYTVASQNYMKEYFFPSTLNMKLKEADQDLLVLGNDEFSQPDGLRSRCQKPGAYQWRIYGQPNHWKPTPADIPLSKVTFSNRDSDGDMDEFLNDFDSTVPLPSPTKESSSCEFESLKQARIEAHRARLQQLIDQFSTKK